MEPRKVNMHEKLAHINAGSPFRFKYNFQTPPSKLGKVKNPFEPHLYERLHTQFFSPSVFVKKTPKKDEKFQWTIDDISIIKPIHIDEDQYETPEHDPAIDVAVQSRIDRFFAMQEIVPSPCGQSKPQTPLIKGSPMSSTPSNSKPTKTDNTAQTVLTLPPILPDHIEELLKPFCTYTKDQQGGEASNNNSLYRKLFDYDEKECSSEHSTPAKSLEPNLPPLQYSPFGGGFVGRNMGSPLNDDELKDCLLSPISQKAENKAVTKLNFSNHHMSIDMSFTVPDVGDLPDSNKTVEMENRCIKSFEPLNESTVLWDMEFKQMESPVNSSSTDEMDVSNSNTPKSRKLGQRKKLSESFHKENSSDDEEKVLAVVLPNKKIIGNDLTDAGYQTGCMMSSDESATNQTNLFASTPTKNKVIPIL